MLAKLSEIQKSGAAMAVETEYRLILMRRGMGERRKPSGMRSQTTEEVSLRPDVHM
jgi:hypothetical protein